MKITRAQLRKIINETVSNNMLSEATLIGKGKIPTTPVEALGHSDGNFGVEGGSSAKMLGFIRYPAGAAPAATQGFYYFIEDEAGYEYVLYMSKKDINANMTQNDDGSYNREWSKISNDKAAVAITKSPKSSKTTRQNPTIIDPTKKKAAYDAVRGMFTAWEDNYDKGEGAKKSKEASDAARSEKDEKIAAAKEKFNAAVELGNDLARKQFGQNAPDATRLISAASGGYGYKKGYVWNKANAVRVGQLLTKLKADADKLWTTIKDADGKVVLSSAWAVAFNTYLDRTKRIMKGPPYSFKGDYEPYEIFKYSRNESKPAKGTAYAASGANAKSREMMAAWEKFGKAQGWANNTGKYTLTGWPEGSTVSESMVKHTQKPIHEITLSDHFLMPDNGDMIKNVNPDCTHFGSEGEVSSVDALPDDVGHVISYEVTNDGPTYRQGDVLTKTLDQLETMSEGRNLNEHTTERGILKEWLQNRLDGILSD